MDHQQIKNIIKRHFKKLKKRFKNATRHYDTEAIHQFRISYKKLRAFLRMMSSSNGAKEVKLSRKIKGVYAAMGSIRDLQLQQMRILEISKQEPKKPWDYIRLLQEHINKLKPRLNKTPFKKITDQNIKKINTLIPDSFDLNNFKNYSNKIWAKIYSIIERKSFTDPDLHSIRKYLKDLFYNQKEFAGVHKEITQVLDGAAGKDDKFYDLLLEKMGDFQDKCTAIELLQPKWLDELNANSQALLTRIREVFIADKQRIQDELIHELINDLAPPMT